MDKGVTGKAAVGPETIGRLQAVGRQKSRIVWLKQLRKMDLETPFKVIDLDEVRRNVYRLKQQLSRTEIYYSIKSNSDKQLIGAIKNSVEGFEIASLGEFNILKSLGISAKRIIFSNPVKVPSHIEATYKAGVSHYAFDSLDEVKKLALYAPNAKVYARIKVGDSRSKFPLSKKFGMAAVDAPGYMTAAMLAGLQPVGLTFHVGSQTEDPQAWVKALRLSGRLINKLTEYGIAIEIVNIGGGIPAAYSAKLFSISAITRAINASLKRYIPAHVKVIAELGRSISASSSVIATSVIARDTRPDNREWLFLDMGVFQGLIEPLEMPDWRYPIFTDYTARLTQNFVLTGPTCDAYDTIGFDYQLPSRLTIGDRLYIGSAGAYTSVYSSNFNGFRSPKIYYLEGGQLKTT